MKFSIIFLFLAAAASLGMAKEPTHASVGSKNEATSTTGLPVSTTVPPTMYTPTPDNKSKPPKDEPSPPPPPPASNDPLAQIKNLSPQCQTALLGIVANPEFLTCVPIPALLPLLPVLTDPTVLPKLLKDPVHTLPPLLTPVFDGVCAAPKCSDKGVAEALQTLNAGCKKDASDPLIVILTGVITFYSPIRDTICFKTNKGEYCVFDTLQKVFSLPKPPITITGTIIDNIAFAEPKEICTPCNKAIVNTIFNFLNADTNHSVEFLAKLGVPEGLINIAKLGVAVKCGFQFLDGKVGNPGKTDPDDFEYQLSSNQVGAANVKGISLVTMIGAFLVSILMI